MKYIVPQELRTKTKLYRFIYLSDLLFIMAYVAVMNFFSLFVAKEISALYFIFNILVSISLTAPSPFNKQKKMYHSLLYLIIKDKWVYKPVVEKE